MSTAIDAPADGREDEVAAVRRFNRFYTRLIRVLDDGILDSAHTLTEARVLFELAAVPSAEAVALRARLGLDAGYLSRIVARFEADGLVKRRRAPDDGRKVVLALTDAGREAFAVLDRASARQVGELLAGLDGPRRRRVLDAMGAIEAAFGAPGPDGRGGPGGHRGPNGRGGPGEPVPTVVLRPPEPGDMGWIVARHGALYAEEYGWDASYEGWVAHIAGDLLLAGDDSGTRTWVAEAGGERAGSVACARVDDETARLRILLVEPHARGLGVGGRLVDECLRFARRAGYRRITLHTYDVLTAARRIYERAGFTLDGERPEHAFGHDLLQQDWSRDL